MSEDAATQRAPGNAFQRVIDSSHVGICLQKGCVIIIIIMSRASFEGVVERKKKSTPPNTREMKCFNKDGVGGVTILIQTILYYPRRVPGRVCREFSACAGIRTQKKVFI